MFPIWFHESLNYMDGPMGLLHVMDLLFSSTPSTVNLLLPHFPMIPFTHDGKLIPDWSRCMLHAHVYTFIHIHVKTGKSRLLQANSSFFQFLNKRSVFYLFIYPGAFLSVCIALSVYLSVFQSVCLSVCLLKCTDNCVFQITA